MEEHCSLPTSIEKAKDSAIIDVDGSLATTMEKKLKALPATEPYTLSRVPTFIRKKNKNLYEPMSIAIGPYYHGQSHLQAMEKHKWRYLRDLLYRPTTEAILPDLLLKMQALEKQARECYQESIDLKSDEFVEMMVLDACFIIEFFFKFDEGCIPLNFEFIDTDLLLLENQIPFFVIQDLVILVANGCSIISLVYKYLKNGVVKNNSEIPQPPKIHHLLHLYYHWFLPAYSSLHPSRGY